MPRITIANAKELSDMARPIIEAHHPHLKLLKIAYVFRDVAAITDEKVIAGMCCRVDDRNWAIHKQDIIIEIAKDVWEEATPEFRIALLDHELSHAGIRMDDGSPVMDEMTNRIKTYIRKHDIEEFEDVLERHGTYHKGLRSFLDAFAKRQLAAKKEKTADKDV